MSQFDLKNAVVRFKDGTGTPKKLDLKVGDGNITFDETRTVEYVKDRGKLSEVRLGDEMPMDVSFDIIWSFLKAVSTLDITPEDALKQRGGAAAWVSSDSDLCAPYAVDIEIWYDPQCTTQKIESILLPDYRYEKLNHNAKSGMIASSGKCNATQATINRYAQT